MSTTNVVPFNPAGSLDITSLFGAQFGKDTSKNFVASFNGLAVKSSDRYIVPTLVNGQVQVLDVTGLTLPVDPLVYRVPVTFDGVQEGRFIVTGDSPSDVLFVAEKLPGDPSRIRGYVPERGEEVVYVAPKNLFNFNFFTQVISILDLLAPAAGGGASGPGGSPFFGGAGGILPLLLLSGGGDKSALLIALMMASSQGLGAGGLNPQLLLLMGMLSDGKGEGQNESLLETLLLMQGITGGTSPFSASGQSGSNPSASRGFGPPPRPPRRSGRKAKNAAPPEQAK